MCESVSCSACDLDGFGILVFGPQTRNLHPGGSGRGGLESGGWQCRGPEGGGTAGGGGKNGLSLSLSPLRLLLSFSLPSHVFSCSSCRSPHSLSGSYRQEFKDHFCTPAQPGGPKPVGGHAGQRQKTHPTKDLSVSFPQFL